MIEEIITDDRQFGLLSISREDLIEFFTHPSEQYIAYVKNLSAPEMRTIRDKIADCLDDHFRLVVRDLMTENFSWAKEEES